MWNSIRNGFASTALITAAVMFATAASAEDIDIFTFPRSEQARADVLIVLDNSANWSANISVANCSYTDGSGGPVATNPGMEQGKKMAIEKCALYNVFDTMPLDAFNVGIMLTNEVSTSLAGAYPRHRIVQVDATNRDALQNTIRNITLAGDNSSNAAFAKSLYESYLYLTEQAPYRGTAGNEYDPLAFVAGRYQLPSDVSCEKHIIFITNGRPGDTETPSGEVQTLLRNAGGDTTQITYTKDQNVSNSDAANWSDEFARFVFKRAAIKVHTIAVTDGNEGNYPNFIANIAKYGGGSYESASNAEALEAALRNIFNRIQAVSGVFSSASLPVSVNQQGVYDNQIFMGMFLPDGDLRPRWYGNIKQYEFAHITETDTLRLVDSTGRYALNVSGGFFDPNAISYWTTPSTFWRNDPSGVPPSPSDSPDGAIIAKGGAAQMLRNTYPTADGQATRKVFTCIGCSTADTTLSADTAGAATSFDKSNNLIENAMLGVASDTESDALIDWVRGADNIAGELGPADGITTVRPSIHGDVLHSRAAVVNYGGTKGVVVFYGANDGMLHAIRGEKKTSDHADAGKHLWSFVPEEHFSKFSRLRANYPLIQFPHLKNDESSLPRDYFVDGPISTLKRSNASGGIEKLYLYVGMRRGGRFMYAFDVTDPAAPVFIWKQSHATLPKLGQTWSEARVAKLKGYVDDISGNSKPVLIMGGGYDPVEDAETPGTVTMGNVVLVLDAVTGELIHEFPTDRSVPGDVEPVDSDGDGYIDRAYASDVGGKIYRIDFESTDTDTGVTQVGKAVWQIQTFADVSSMSKKFLYGPEVVVTSSYVIVQAGTGDREKPLSTTTQDYFYAMKDTQVIKGATLTTLTDANLASLATYGSTPSALGCFYGFQQGEKVVNAPKTTFGVTYFATNRPTPSASTACKANLGEARTYAAPVFCDGLVYTKLEGGGLPPSPVAGSVKVGDKIFNFLIGGADTKAATEALLHPGNASPEDPTQVVIPPRKYDPDNPLASGTSLFPSETCNYERSSVGGCDVDPNLNTRRQKIYWTPETER